ncbi:MAG: hypothetical protein MRJ67_17065 [Nitrospirales bacterium]|nr:hypothetical protein [Nitrospirales bacterium]MDR4482745.1 hypothetical protein [Nitrospirales bacterium]
MFLIKAFPLEFFDGVSGFRERAVDSEAVKLFAHFRPFSFINGWEKLDLKGRLDDSDVAKPSGNFFRQSASPNPFCVSIALSLYADALNFR